jgi:probable HAF family extracellular repeat protein
MAGLVATLIGNHPSAMAGYDFTTLTDPDGAGYTVASGINNAGEVVGTYRDASNVDHGFSFSGGFFTKVDVPQSTSTNANGVNSAGDIIGAFTDAKGSHGFVLHVTAYTPFDDPTAVGNTTGSGINNNGQLVGTFFEGTSRGYIATGLPLPPSGFTPVNALTGVGTNVGINDGGVVVGSYVDGTGTHGFRTIGTSTITLDDPLAVGLGINSVTAATGIDNAGDIVGYFVGASNVTYGFVYAGGVYTTIDDPDAIGLTQVFGINDQGDLVGMYFGADGVRGFVAVPAVPEPNTLALLGISLAGTMIVRRRRNSGR